MLIRSNCAKAHEEKSEQPAFFFFFKVDFADPQCRKPRSIFTLPGPVVWLVPGFPTPLSHLHKPSAVLWLTEVALVVMTTRSRLSVCPSNEPGFFIPFCRAILEFKFHFCSGDFLFLHLLACCIVGFHVTCAYERLNCA